MPKPGVIRSRRRRLGQRRTALLPNAVEGQIEEICRDLAVHAKRLRDLQEQADELRVVIREWAAPPDVDSDH